MNKIFRVIWCRVKAACVVVSEEACLRGGKSHSCRQGSRAAGEESVRFALSSIALAACILIGSLGSTLPAVAGTVIGGGAQYPNSVGGTSSTTGDLGNSYIGASGMGTAITGDNDCLSLTSTRNVLNSANVGWLLGTTSQTTDPGPLYPGPGAENNQTISYSGTSNFRVVEIARLVPRRPSPGASIPSQRGVGTNRLAWVRVRSGSITWPAWPVQLRSGSLIPRQERAEPRSVSTTLPLARAALQWALALKRQAMERSHSDTAAAAPRATPHWRAAAMRSR